MHHKMRNTIIIVLVVAMPLIASASGTTAADFLNINVSAYQASLGGAGSALSDDIAASYFNPAGLSNLEKPGVNFMHNLWYQDISYEFLGGAFPVGGKTTIAASAAYLHMGQIEGYNALNQSTGAISPHSLVGIVSFSRSISHSLSIGLSGKYITEKLDDVSATGYAFDLGAQFHFSDFSIGAVANNIGPKVKYETDSFSLPTSVSFGTAYSSFQLPVTILAGANVPFDGKTSFAAGLEYQMAGFMSLRSGYGGMGGDNASNSLNLGAGLNLAGINIDYAFNPGGDMGQTHFFSFTLSFGSSRQINFDNSQPVEITPAPAVISESDVESSPAAAVIDENSIKDDKLAKSTYVVCAGNFSDRESAEKQVEVLKRFGIKSKTEAQAEGKYRVTVTKTDNFDKAEKLQKKIISEGFNSTVDTE
ncbi:MAG: PorV/PorQ family protein [candidate division Zixibacteria bacterium]|nr:PorV/PorQ family protein [candidate division Zixibacteria bacterium]